MAFCLLAKPGEDNLYPVRVDFFQVGKKMLMQCNFGKQGAGVLHQTDKVFIFTLRQGEFASVWQFETRVGATQNPYLAVFVISGSWRNGHWLSTDAPPQCIDCSNEFARINRLDEIVISPGLQTGNPVLGAASGGNDNNTQIAVMAKVAQGCEPIFTGQTKVDQNNICRQNGALTIEFFGAGGTPGGEVLAAQRQQQIGAQVFVVFYDGKGGECGERVIHARKYT